jgi:hypothetical protein
VGDAMSEVKNPKKRPSSHLRSKDSLNIPAMVDDFFHTRVNLKEGETSRYVTSFEAIIHHLWLKETAGSPKAGKLLTRYMNFAASQGSSGGIEVRIIPDPPKDKEVK